MDSAANEVDNTPAASGPPPPPRARLAVRVIAASLVAIPLLLVGVVVTELALRSSYAQRLYDDVRRHPPHPFLQVVPSGQVDHVNAEGFRGDEIALDKPPRTFRIFAIGGSTTLGIANPYDDSYPRLLQAQLQARYPGITIEVQNAGGAWYTTAHDVVAYELRVRRYHPDLIVFFEAINDLVRSFSPPWLARGPFQSDYSHYLGPYARMAGPGVDTVDHGSSWMIVNLLRRALGESPDPLDIRHPDNVARVAAMMRAVDHPVFRSLPSFREYYGTLLDDALADHVAVVAASQPSIYRADLSPDDRERLYFGPLMCADDGTYPSLAAMIDGMRAYNQEAAAVAAAHHVTFLDFDGAVPKTGAYFSDDVHMRRAGNAKIAAVAADAIIRSGLVDRTVSQATAKERHP